MIENNKNRFTDNETDCLIDSSFTDNLTKKIYSIDEWERIIGLCNNLWNQTQRFEKENQRLNNEFEQLKQAYTQLKHRHSLLHDVCVDAECERDSLKKDVNSLEKENEQLKQRNDFLKKQLDRVCIDNETMGDKLKKIERIL